ncbi:unnamed protein product [Orchesella dallaii]|uniref:MAM domain-containing protein n=1 Tax=Orchesella dallaii TaxID=48710 RepID=A0ABP1S1U3_9HEXA
MEINQFPTFILALAMVFLQVAIANTRNSIDSLTMKILSATLDVDNGNIPNEWTISPFQQGRMEYYSSSLEFLEGGENTPWPNFCAETFAQLPEPPSLREVTGIWVSCEAGDEEQIISYTARQLEGFRTLNVSYYLHNTAILRLTVSRNCYDYSTIETESNCEFVPYQNSGDWQQLSYLQNENTESKSFTRFTIEMISRAVGDYVLVDKVDASVYLDCGEEDPVNCPRPTTPLMTSTTTSSTIAPSITTPVVSSSTFRSTPIITTTTTRSTSISTSPTSTFPPELPKNITLETKYENNTGWKIPKDIIPKWFEYYNSTTIFNSEAQNQQRCASIGQNFESLSEVDGVWVACQDPELPIDCAVSVSSPCHPLLHYDTGTSQTSRLKTIKLSFALYGMALLRLSIGDKCIDFSYREDPFSLCEFSQVSPTTRADGWVLTQFSFDPYENVAFESFTLELIARFANDVVLLDKVEATEYLFCGPDISCQTTTRTTTTPPPIIITELPTTTFQPENRTLFLDSSDFIEDNKSWNFPCTSAFPRWLEYYRDSYDFLTNTFIFNSCSYQFSLEQVNTSLLDYANGLWVACKDPDLPWDECVISSRAPCHPFIRLGSDQLYPHEAIGSIEIAYFLYGNGAIRLNLYGGKCIEYSQAEDINSLCEFVQASSNPENEWQMIYYEPENNYWIRDFQIDLIAKDDHDFVLIDKVAANIYKVCDYTPAGCSDFTTQRTETTTGKMTTDDDDFTSKSTSTSQEPSTETITETEETSVTYGNVTIPSTSTTTSNSGISLYTPIYSQFAVYTCIYVFVCIIKLF